MSPFEAYRFATALTAHFRQESFDFFRYRGAIRAKRETFETSNLRFRYEKLSRDFKDYEIRDFLLANLIADSKWTIFDPQSQARYNKFRGYKDARQYHFRNEVRKLYQYCFEHGIMYTDIFREIDGNCIALNSYLAGEMSIDTFVILDAINPFIDGLCSIDMVKKALCQKAVKYRPFVKVDLDIFSKIESEFAY